jgi:hypothetical protein
MRQAGSGCRGPLMTPVGAGSRPGDGAHMPLVDPFLIALLAVVTVLGRWGQGRQLGQGLRESLPEDLSVTCKATRAQALEIDRPALTEWIVHQSSPGPRERLRGRFASSRGFRRRHRPLHSVRASRVAPKPQDPADR